MSKFNPLNYAQALKEAGFPEKQACLLTEGFMILIDELASKEDLKNLEQRLDKRIDHLEEKMDVKFNAMDVKINAVDTKLNWLITMMGVIGILIGVLNFFHLHC